MNTTKIEGKIMLQSNRKIYANKVLALEMWLNDTVASMAYQKFKIGLRVHLSVTPSVKNNDSQP